MRLSKKEKRERRHHRIRAKIKGTATRPRLCVFRSNKYIYAMIINDESGKTLLHANDIALAKAKNSKTTKTARAFTVGKTIAQIAQSKNIKRVVFDKAGYKYHGRVKALAQGAREGGLEF